MLEFSKIMALDPSFITDLIQLATNNFNQFIVLVLVFLVVGYVLSQAFKIFSVLAFILAFLLAVALFPYYSALLT